MVRKLHLNEAKEAEQLYRQFENTVNKLGTNDVKTLYNTLSGFMVGKYNKCDTVAGELIRAMIYVMHKYLNDGQLIYDNNGLEDAIYPAAYVMDNGGDEVHNIFNNLLKNKVMPSNTKSYKDGLYEAARALINYLGYNEQLFSEYPLNSCFDYSGPSYETIRNAVYDDYKNKDYEFEFDRNYLARIGISHEYDLQGFMEYCADEVDGRYGCSTSPIGLHHLTYSSYLELKSNWRRYAEEFLEEIEGEDEEDY